MRIVTATLSMTPKTTRIQNNEELRQIPPHSHYPVGVVLHSRVPSRTSGTSVLGTFSTCRAAQTSTLCVGLDPLSFVRLSATIDCLMILAAATVIAVSRYQPPVVGGPLGLGLLRVPLVGGPLGLGLLGAHDGGTLPLVRVAATVH